MRLIVGYFLKSNFRARWRLARASECRADIKADSGVDCERVQFLEQSRPKAAAEMANTLLADVEEAVRLAVFTNQWEMAIMTSSQGKRVDLIETEIRIVITIVLFLFYAAVLICRY